jgi:hypothetical protein
MREDLSRDFARLLRDTGSTFLSVDKTVFRFTVPNARPAAFACRTPLGTASFPLRSDERGPVEEER